MVDKLNATFFDGKPRVSCASCHNGRANAGAHAAARDRDDAGTGRRGSRRRGRGGRGGRRAAGGRMRRRGGAPGGPGRWGRGARSPAAAGTD